MQCPECLGEALDSCRGVPRLCPPFSGLQLQGGAEGLQFHILGLPRALATASSKSLTTASTAGARLPAGPVAPQASGPWPPHAADPPVAQASHLERSPLVPPLQSFRQGEGLI
jgi:hypothetical protein